MGNSRRYYLLHIQYLGFRYHGWAKQKAYASVHEMVDKTLRFVLRDIPFKTLGGSRTDAKVSAGHFVLELFIDHDLEEGTFLEDLNYNFPPDIKALDMEEVDAAFNIIQSDKIKEYIYLFAFGEKPHPFSAPLVVTFPEKLDLELMVQSAPYFEGEHDFRNYCTKPSEGTRFVREVLHSRISSNTHYQASFFPKETWCYTVRGKGFLRNQIRHMMGQLVELGRGNIDLEQFKLSIDAPDGKPFKTIAPASGLILHSIEFQDHSTT